MSAYTTDSAHRSAPNLKKMSADITEVVADSNMLFIDTASCLLVDRPILVGNRDLVNSCRGQPEKRRAVDDACFGDTATKQHSEDVELNISSNRVPHFFKRGGVCVSWSVCVCVCVCACVCVCLCVEVWSVCVCVCVCVFLTASWRLCSYHCAYSDCYQ